MKKNAMIEDYLRFLNVKGNYEKVYDNFYMCRLISDSGEVMTILNIFESIMVTVGNVKIGTFKKGIVRDDLGNLYESWISA